MTIFLVKLGSQFQPWFSDSNHPYPKHPHRTGRNSSFPYDTLDCILPTYINRYWNGFRRGNFVGSSQPTASKHWRQKITVILHNME